MTNGKITILQLCEHFGGQASSLHGVARGFQWWVPAFDSSRYNVILCSRKGYDKAAEQMIQSGIQPRYLGYGKLDPRNLIALIRLLRGERVDIIQAHGYGACLWGRLAGHLLRIPVIIHERCNYKSVPLFQRPVEFLLGPFTRYGFAVSASSRQFCIDHRYMKGEIIDVVYNGLPLKDIEIASAEWVRKTRAELGADDSTDVIGIVCRLEPYKGHVDAFQAFQKVLQERPNAKLWIAGDGTYEPELRAWVQENNLDSSVRFLGFRSDIRKLIQCFDVQLFPSHQEGTPNTLYEALAVGNVIVASTTDGQGEILTNEKEALLFEPGETDAMASHLLHALSDSEIQRRLSTTALERASDFDGQKCIDTMQRKYDRVMEEHPPKK